ncbi:DUF3429 domain-containing protein [Pseudoalteromonas phenolica]|uniref:DUF3429 domain-containing protein n=1 Tax=Pseudoalteromonas phenolica TaxID=161398 RepID=A0A5R9PXY3_9GAMM|nr:DUF3429 domain-containing protein [Pseudoalteromonas phenolica]TLX45252.1 DUF3429 domain-containing protein [Pseudoalteromonas phenolica]
MHSFSNHVQLGYYGVLPFLACIFGSLILGSNEALIKAFTLYSLGISAFCAGVMWRPGDQSITHAVMAVLLIIPFPLLAFATTTITLAYLAICYPLILLFERGMPVWQSYHKDYHKMRFVLTSVLFVSHLFMIAQQIELSTNI